ncbi:hypothetical protein MG290_09600 [Flavobacterium sp. CBA20B-1]|uniref:hypothetical protein n=1 Tax=unclassified Flavobacterium TaxID=196869 RepID=UPI002225331C|nr:MULTISPECIES: hypothetical protein [unclassified Flavobacterium]WCM41211.1 hypothetical protein MG290_09600 [Flavobacterium sp. CBA20B-1]
MKNYILLLLAFFCQLYSFAQTFKVVIKNSETNEPISQITIVNADQTFFVTSNEKGEVVLPEKILNQKLFVDDYQYTFSENKFTKMQDFVWELTPNSETLEEIIIFSDVRGYLEEIINNSIKSFSTDASLESYYRENYYENNEIASFSEGMVDFFIDKETKNVLQIAKQTRSENFVEVNDFNRDIISSPKEVVEGSMRFKRILGLIKDKKNYDISVTAKQVGDKTIHTCYISPKEKSKKRHLKKAYFSFDAEKKLIYETNYAFDPEKKKHNTTMNLIIGKIKIDEQQFQSKYIIGDNFYYPSYTTRTIEMVTSSKLAKMKDVKVHNQVYFYVLNAETNSSKPNITKTLNNETLYSKGSIYKDEFWKLPEIINLQE